MLILGVFRGTSLDFPIISKVQIMKFLVGTLCTCASCSFEISKSHKKSIHFTKCDQKGTFIFVCKQSSES